MWMPVSTPSPKISGTIRILAMFRLIPNSELAAKVSTIVTAIGISTNSGNVQPRKYIMSSTKIAPRAVAVACWKTQRPPRRYPTRQDSCLQRSRIARNLAMKASVASRSLSSVAGFTDTKCYRQGDQPFAKPLRHLLKGKRLGVQQIAQRYKPRG